MNLRNFLLTKSDLVQVDQNKIYHIYERWPQYFKEAAKLSCKIDHDPQFYESIILCGVGGSATSCDILSDVLYNYCSIPCYVVRGNNMPRTINRKSLVVVNSVSGNTQEAVSMMHEASERGSEVVSITSGGKLKEKTAMEGHKTIDIPNLSLPRAALPYLIIPGLSLIEGFLSKSFREEISFLDCSISRIANNISIDIPYEHNVAKKIAGFIDNGFSFCFSSPSLTSVANRFKNSLNENAKVHCINESILEASHNEIVPFTFNRKAYTPTVLFVRWSHDPQIVSERFTKVGLFFKGIRQPFKELNMFNDDLLTAIISSIYILDYSTIYMAIAHRIDPTPTPAIDILKKN
jgi:glucose/mannose-6-phosphate isomerase